jgi:hypothetical protein
MYLLNLQIEAGQLLTHEENVERITDKRYFKLVWSDVNFFLFYLISSNLNSVIRRYGLLTFFSSRWFHTCHGFGTIKILVKQKLTL